MNSVHTAKAELRVRLVIKTKCFSTIEYHLLASKKNKPPPRRQHWLDIYQPFFKPSLVFQTLIKSTMYRHLSFLSSCWANGRWGVKMSTTEASKGHILLINLPGSLSAQVLPWQLPKLKRRDVEKELFQRPQKGFWSPDQRLIYAEQSRGDRRRLEKGCALGTWQVSVKT